MTTALEIHAHLLDLRAQRALASAMVDVDGEIEATTRAAVAQAIATLRQALHTV